MAERSTPVSHIMLGIVMRHERDRLNLKQDKLATELNYSRSTLANAETAHQLPSSGVMALLDKLYRKLDARYGKKNYLAELLELAATEGGPALSRHMYEEEKEATSIRSYHGVFVPGPCQTRKYMHELFEEGKRTYYPDTDVVQAIALREGRGKRLLRPDAPWQQTLVNEAVLHSQVVKGKARYRQMVRLRESMDHPRMTIRILPFSAGKSTPNSTFRIIDTPKRSSVYFEGHLSVASLIRYDETTIKAATKSFDSVWAEAAPRSQSIEMVDEWIERLKYE